jgi:hypothetical protein
MKIKAALLLGRKIMPDISENELDQLHDRIDAEILRNGAPTEDELGTEIEGLNKTAKENARNSPNH